ncbi:hypothetical protein K438DRAFT_486182 [Mycena galopus ATCC 62051]|nr:hypothetical protein K438DRAFT_486182 [Mycena galopus ATCC 62051]
MCTFAVVRPTRCAGQGKTCTRGRLVFISLDIVPSARCCVMPTRAADGCTPLLWRLAMDGVSLPSTRHFIRRRSAAARVRSRDGDSRGEPAPRPARRRLSSTGTRPSVRQVGRVRILDPPSAASPLRAVGPRWVSTSPFPWIPPPYFPPSFSHHAFFSSFHPSPFFALLLSHRRWLLIVSQMMTSRLSPTRLRRLTMSPRPHLRPCLHGDRNGSCASAWHGKRKLPTACEFEHTLILTLCATPILPSLAACPAVLVFYLPFPSARTLNVSLYPRHGSRRGRLSGFVTTLIAVCSFVCICVRVWTSARRPASSPPPRAPLRPAAVPAAYRLRMGRIPIRLAQCADRIGRARFSSGLAHSVSIHVAPLPAPPSLVHPRPRLRLRSQTASSSWPPAPT